MKKCIISGLLLSIVVLFVASCDIINPEEDIPAYIQIEPFTLSTIGVEGSASSKIVQGWLFVNEVFLGVYDLPATVPVLASGPTEVRVEAGIADNGISSTPEIYPFYEPFEVQLDLVPSETTTISPRTFYIADAKFGFIEDFELNSERVFTDQITGSTPILQTTEDVFEGTFSGQFSVVKGRTDVVELGSVKRFSDLQANGVFVYLEVDYKSEVPVFWGVAGEQDVVTGLERYIDPGFAPNEEWNKIYFNITQQVFDSNLPDYQVILQAITTSQAPDSALVYLDNIKLVHF